MVNSNDEDIAVNSLQVNTVLQSVKPIRKRKTISVSINGKLVPSMLIDSGSDITVLSLKFCQAIQLAFKPISSPPKAIGVTGNAIKLVGCVNNACIETKDGFFIDNVWVAKDLNTDAILGDSSLSAFQALTIRYGDGHLPTLEVKEVRIESF